MIGPTDLLHPSPAPHFKSFPGIIMLHKMIFELSTLGFVLIGTFKTLNKTLSYDDHDAVQSGGYIPTYQHLQDTVNDESS